MTWQEAVTRWVRRLSPHSVTDERAWVDHLQQESATQEARIALLRRQVMVMQRGRGDARRVSDTDT